MSINRELEVVSRQQAAKRQITTANELMFGKGDAVSANVLAWSATEMLRGVAAAEGVQTFHATLEERVKEERIKEWRNILKGHYNYFKHADRDPYREIEDFSKVATTWAIFAAIFDYFSIYNMRTWPMLVYQMWFSCRYPDIVHDEMKDMFNALAPGLAFPEGKPLDKAIVEAREMMETGRKHPELLDALGPKWLQTIESE